jgi:iron donor protein CyaY
VTSIDAEEYQQRAEACLQRVARWAEQLDPDEVDFTTRDGMVELEFADGVRFVLNRQSGARQMWFAAIARAWHYGWDPARQTWADDRDGHDLYARVAEVTAEKVGHAVPAP